MLEELNPNIRYASLHHYATRDDVMHMAYDCRLFYVIEGEIGVESDGDFYSLQRFDTVFIPPGVAYMLTYNKKERFSIAVFNFDQTTEQWDNGESLGTSIQQFFDFSKISHAQCFEPFTKIIICKNITGIRSNCEDIINLYFSKSFEYREYASAIMKTVLLKINSRLRNSDRNFALADQIREYINQNALESISADIISKHFGYHPYYLNRIFKMHTGSTMNQYLIDYRLRIAENLLITTNISIAEVAVKSGFSDIAYFSRLFGKKLGLSPRSYRSKSRSRLI